MNAIRCPDCNEPAGTLQIAPQHDFICRIKRHFPGTPTKCAICKSDVKLYLQVMKYACNHVSASEETITNGHIPAAWWPMAWFNLGGSTAPQPADRGDGKTCHKCGKEMEVLGLRGTYPPKRDDMGRAICPHCGAFSGHVTGFTSVGPKPYNTHLNLPKDDDDRDTP